jgi:hypothetical protein
MAVTAGPLTSSSEMTTKRYGERRPKPKAAACMYDRSRHTPHGAAWLPWMKKVWAAGRSRRGGQAAARTHLDKGDAKRGEKVENDLLRVELVQGVVGQREAE